MLQKHRKLIFAILAVLLVGLLICGIFFYFSVPRLSRKEKELVRTEFINYYFHGKPEKDRLGSDPAMIWYDENGYIEEENVWRYVGKYGDCYAFLVIGDGYTADGIAPIPYPMMGLAWTVYYPRQAFVYLYHTKREFNREMDGGIRYTTRIAELYHRYVETEKWLTDEQLEQLTRDIEKIAHLQPFVPLLHNWEKNAVRQEYFERYCKGELNSYFDYPITWYDENGYIEEEDVWRYVGKYGDCYAFLRIGDNKNLNGKPTPDPYPLRGLARTVFYPNEAEVYLYHTQRDFEINKGYGIITTRIAELYELKMETQNRKEWLTDEQLEQLTRYIEKLAKD